MALRQILLCAFVLISPLLAAGRAQDAASSGGAATSSAADSSADSSAVSSDDIRVADGLQLPSYGHAWMLDTWQGIHELVELRAATPSDRAITLNFHRAVELPGEQAAVRSHVGAPIIFIREPAAIYESRTGGGLDHSQFAIIPLQASHRRRKASSAVLDSVAAIAKGKPASSSEVVELKQESIGNTGWYRLTPKRALAPGDYALVPLPGSPAAALDEVYGFAVDPEAPENPRALRSERDRDMNP